MIIKQLAILIDRWNDSLFKKSLSLIIALKDLNILKPGILAGLFCFEFLIPKIMSMNSNMNFVIILIEKDEHKPGNGFLRDPAQKHTLNSMQGFV